MKHTHLVSHIANKRADCCRARMDTQGDPGGAWRHAYDYAAAIWGYRYVPIIRADGRMGDLNDT